MRPVEIWLRGLGLVATLVLVLSIASCGHETAESQELSSTRPGMAGSENRTNELEDEVWRVSGPGCDIRYDRGGILFKTLSDGSVEISDFDGGCHIYVRSGVIGADSLVSEVSFNVNGQEKAMASMKMLKKGDGRVWYEAFDSEDDRWVMVLP